MISKVILVQHQQIYQNKNNLNIHKTQILIRILNFLTYIMDVNKFRDQTGNEELKLQTIEEDHNEEQQAISRIVTTSPIKFIAKKNQFNTLQKQYNISSLSKKKSLFLEESNNKSTINNHLSNTRHRRNKTQVDIKSKNKQKDPVYNCLYVPFLQTKVFNFTSSDSKKSKIQNSQSTTKPRMAQPPQPHSERSFSYTKNNSSDNGQKSISLPGIKKSHGTNQIQVTEKNQQIKTLTDISKRKTSVQKQQKVNSKGFNLSQIGHIGNSTTIQIQNPSKRLTAEQRNLKQFKLKERQSKIRTKKSKKVQEWKEINFLQLKTCYYHIEKKMIEKSILSNGNDLSISRSSQKKNNEIPDLKRKILLHQRNPKIPKFPSSIEEVSLIIKNFSSIRKNKVSIDHLIKSKNFRVKFVQKQMLYFGQMNNQLNDGYGVLIKPDQIFQGNWSQGKRISGTESKKGIFYEGDFIQNKKQGFGISYWNNGSDQYSGEWKNGQKNGNGVWKNLDGDQYIGQWINGKVQGFGVHTTADGQKYQGYFVNFLKHGKGKEIFPNGDSFQGNFYEGKPGGYGVYNFGRGNVKYEGQFSKGVRQGKGKLIVPGLFTYEGDFSTDNVQGYGKIDYINNDNYIGHFQEGLRHGNGSFHNVKQNTILSGIWRKGGFFQKSKENNVT